MAVYDRATKAVLPEEQNEVSKQGIAFNEDRQFFTASVIRTTSFKFNIDKINSIKSIQKSNSAFHFQFIESPVHKNCWL